MTTSEQPRTASATRAVVRRGQETKAAALREAGWLVIPPEMLAHGTLARIDRVCEVEGFTREEAARMLIARGLMEIVPVTMGDPQDQDQGDPLAGWTDLGYTTDEGRRP